MADESYQGENGNSEQYQEENHGYTEQSYQPVEGQELQTEEHSAPKRDDDER